jgi:hypothetical protein
MKIAFKDRIFKARRDAYEKYCRNMAAEDKAQEKDAAQKEAENFEERQRKEIEKFRLQKQRKRQKEHEKALKDAAKLQKPLRLQLPKQKGQHQQILVGRLDGRAGRQRHAVRPVADVSLCLTRMMTRMCK